MFFIVNYQNDSLTMHVFSGRKRQRRCQSLVQRAPTTPLLGQLEHLAALRELVEQDGRPQNVGQTSVAELLNFELPLAVDLF